MRRVKNERLNELAQCVQSQWRGHIPLSVRYGAAEAADSVVADWFERTAELEREFTRAELDDVLEPQTEG